MVTFWPNELFLRLSEVTWASKVTWLSWPKQGCDNKKQPIFSFFSSNIFCNFPASPQSILLKFWWNNIYFQFSLLWWKPHLSIFIHFEMVSKTRWLVKKRFFNLLWFSIAIFKRMLKKVPGVAECYGWWKSMASTKSQTNHFSAHDKIEIPGKPNSVLYMPLSAD